MTKEEIKKEIIEDCSYDSNYDYYIMTEQDINILVDELHKKINYTRCCTGEAEQLCQHDRKVTNRVCDDCGLTITYVPDEDLA